MQTGPGPLQQQYEHVLGLLHGVPHRRARGTPSVNAAGQTMLGPSGLEGACQALAAGRLPAGFKVPDDPRFAAVAPPWPSAA